MEVELPDGGLALKLKFPYTGKLYNRLKRKYYDVSTCLLNETVLEFIFYLVNH